MSMVEAMQQAEAIRELDFHALQNAYLTLYLREGLSRPPPHPAPHETSSSADASAFPTLSHARLDRDHQKPHIAPMIRLSFPFGFSAEASRLG